MGNRLEDGRGGGGGVVTFGRHFACSRTNFLYLGHGAHNLLIAAGLLVVQQREGGRCQISCKIK